MRRIAQFLLASTALALAGCATVPRLGAAPEPRDAATLASARSLAGPVRDWPAADWWAGFGDPQLSALIAEALKGSPDVAAATARIAQAEGIAQQTGAVLQPSLTVDGQVGGNKQSKNLGIPPQFVPDGIQDTGRITATASFNLDLWGRNRAALAAATSEAEAARVDADQAVLMLTTGIAAAYADLAQYHAERDVAVAALKSREATARLTAERVSVGVDARGTLRQAESRVPAARADIAAIDEGLALTRNRIAALLGAGPDRGLTITRPTIAAPPAGLPAGAGIDLIGRRPDIVAARLRAEAAAKRIKVARADFYPNINLGAIVGLQSLGLGRLIDGGRPMAMPARRSACRSSMAGGCRAVTFRRVRNTIRPSRAMTARSSPRCASRRCRRQPARARCPPDRATCRTCVRRRRQPHSRVALPGRPLDPITRPHFGRFRTHRQARRRRSRGAPRRARYRADPRTRRRLPYGDQVMATQPNPTSEPETPPPAKGKRKKLLLILAAVVVTIGILWTIWYFVFDAGRVHTDNAYVGADSAMVTSLVSGAVTEVRVGGTQVVKRGDVLVVIDAADAKIDVATAEAALKQAQQRFGQTAAQAGSAARKSRRAVRRSRRPARGW